MRFVSALLRTLRPRQWTKNVFVLAALLFSQHLLDPTYLWRSLAAFGLFCLLSGCVYTLNDIFDRERDRVHPTKSLRPIAAGELGVPAALVLCIVLAGVALSGSWLLSPRFAVAALVYLLMQVLYSLFLKNAVVLDVLILAFGFVLRVAAGAVAIDVAISAWLLICTTLIALFLALCKRRSEVVSLGDQAAAHRRVLKEYSAQLLDQLIGISASSTVIAYALYTVSEETVAKFGTSSLLYTIPFVIYGIFRYLYLVHQRSKGGRPEHTLLTDPPIVIAGLLYALTAGIILYR